MGCEPVTLLSPPRSRALTKVGSGLNYRGLLSAQPTQTVVDKTQREQSREKEMSLENLGKINPPASYGCGLVIGAWWTRVSKMIVVEFEVENSSRYVTYIT
jgi:hypothetical protein